MHGPRVARVASHGDLGGREGLRNALGLLEGKGVQPQHERVPGIVPSELARHGKHLGKSPLPEPDVVQPLEDREIARVAGEVLAHSLLGPIRSAGDELGHGLHVAALPRRRPGCRPPRVLGAGPRLGETLVEEVADRRASVGHGETRIEGERAVEQVQGGPVPAEQPVDRPIIGVEGTRGGGRDGQAKLITRHDATLANPSIADEHRV